MHAPMLFVDPDFDGTAELVPAMPPATKIGAKSLSGRSAAELAFIAENISRITARKSSFARSSRASRTSRTFFSRRSRSEIPACRSTNARNKSSCRSRKPSSRFWSPSRSISCADISFASSKKAGARICNAGRAASIARCGARGFSSPTIFAPRKPCSTSTTKAKRQSAWTIFCRSCRSDRYGKLRKQLGIAIG